MYIRLPNRRGQGSKKISSNLKKVTRDAYLRNFSLDKLKIYYTIVNSHIVHVSYYFLFLSLRSLPPAPPSNVKVNLRLPFEEPPEHSFSEERTSLPSLSVGTVYLRTRVFKATVSASSFDIGATSSPVRCEMLSTITTARIVAREPISV